MLLGIVSVDVLGHFWLCWPYPGRLHVTWDFVVALAYLPERSDDSWDCVRVSLCHRLFVFHVFPFLLWLYRLVALCVRTPFTLCASFIRVVFACPRFGLTLVVYVRALYGACVDATTTVFVSTRFLCRRAPAGLDMDICLHGLCF